MKLIHNYKSPNFNDRNYSNIELIVIHYTALSSISKSINYLCSPKNKVSSHYLISNKGYIYNLVSDKKRAWHAGQSYWKGDKDINSISIGIELDYFPSYKNKKFPNTLISSLLFLLKKLMERYKILPENVLGHSDIAPYRKIDPGKNFPWQILEEQYFSYKIKKLKNKKKNISIILKWNIENKFKSNKLKILFMMKHIGYDTSLAMKNKLNFNKLIDAYCNHHRYYKNYTYNKKKIFNVIELHFFNLLLTNLNK